MGLLVEVLVLTLYGAPRLLCKIRKPKDYNFTYYIDLEITKINLERIS